MGYGPLARRGINYFPFSKMKIPEHLNKPLLEQLNDQADSDDYLVMRGSALGYGLLNDIENRNEYIQNLKIS